LRHVAKFPNDSLEEIIKKNLLVRFVPENSRDILLDILKQTISKNNQTTSTTTTFANEINEIETHSEASKN